MDLNCNYVQCFDRTLKCNGIGKVNLEQTNDQQNNENPLLHRNGYLIFQ